MPRRKTPNYDVENYDISNQLNLGLKEKRYCQICSRDTYGSRIQDNSYLLKFRLWSGNPCTQVPERKDLTIYMCHACREKVYKAIKNTIAEIQNK